MLVAVLGQTASGKSDLGLGLARRLGEWQAAEPALLNVDAMQLYRGLDVGTAKTPVSQRRGVEHFQIDVLEASQEASVAAYQQAARADVDGLRAAGRPVVAVGGSGLYARALLDHLEFPGSDPAIRAELEADLAAAGSGKLHERLAAVDPPAAAAIHPHNGRRIVRALEAITASGRPFSASLPRQEYFYPGTLAFAVRWPTDQLDQRIAKRTKAMFAPGGIVDEVRALADSGVTFGRTAARATGYAEARAVLSGSLSVEDAVVAVALATRQLARRQEKWFRRDSRIQYLDPTAAAPLLQQALEMLDDRAS